MAKESSSKGTCSGSGVDEKMFDASAPPPFKLSELKEAIPKHCFVKSTPLSLSYFFRDVAIVILLMFCAASLNHYTYLHWPLYWLAQGTIFWSLFVLGHDCGHGSFCDNKHLNHFVGHLAHTFVLVPYHGWRISHRNHHQNHGHVDKDESWHPVPKKLYRELDPREKLFRFTPLALIAYPIYLIFVIWLDSVTYLQHHGYKEKVPWYRGKEWSHIRGGLSTIDRDFGVLNNLMHSVGTHVVHHLFPQIPHYHLVEATNAIKPILGKFYREPTKTSFLPFHLFEQVITSLLEDHYVDDEGDIVFYKCDKSNED